MDPNSRFLLRSFRKYYRANTIPMPDRFARREFGFMMFDRNFMVRHTSFSNQQELQRYMSSQAPRHSYYSTAYYRKPDAPTMEEKGWMGAELIFDLDADHLEGAENMSFEDMLAQIKREMIGLVDSFLFDDMGFSERDVKIVFSGGRGYHAHVKLPDVLELGSHERREIVDYITSRGLDIDWVFPMDSVATGTAFVNGRNRLNIKRFRTIPPADSGGWRLRMRNGLKDVVNDICDMDVSDIKKTYPSVKKNQSLAKIQDDLRMSRDLIFENNRMITLNHNTQELLLKIMKEDMAVRLSGEVDEPVTADIKRLIRLPGSIHGKSGLMVMPLSRDELTHFDPMIQAIPETFKKDTVKVSMRRDYTLNIGGECLNLSGVTEVPKYAAVFLIGKNLADIGDGTREKDDFF